jgi:hypothetical protein
MLPDTVPLIFDTGASISITPYPTDFISPICPVQYLQIKGILSGLYVHGIGDVSYTFTNNNNVQQTMIIRNCLCIPQCVVQLICPQQIGAETVHPKDGLYAQHDNATLIVAGQETTLN